MELFPAAGFHYGDFILAHRAISRSEGLNINLKQGNHGNSIRFELAITSVHNDSAPNHISPFGFGDTDHFEGRPSGSDDTISHQDFFTRFDFKTPSKFHFPIYSFGKDKSYTESPGNLMAYDQPSDCGSNDTFHIEFLDLIGQGFA